MNARIQRILFDALRRQEIRYSEQAQRMVVLGLPPEIRPAMDAGLVTPTNGELPEVLNWYDLTDEGLTEARKLRDSSGRKFGQRGNIDYYWSQT